LLLILWCKIKVEGYDKAIEIQVKYTTLYFNNKTFLTTADGINLINICLSAQYETKKAYLVIGNAQKTWEHQKAIDPGW